LERPEPGTIRCFVCVEVGEEARGALSRWIREARRALPDAKWVRAEHLHVTLRFLGSLSGRVLEDLREGLAKGFSSLAPGGFLLTLGCLGAFPSRGPARVLWVGLEGERERLVRLAEEAEAQAERIGLSRESRPFSPHLTLARAREGRPLLPQDLKGLPEPPEGTIRVSEALLMRSDLRPEGPLYTPLARFPL
jgi:2'-5' RNA ligase